MRETSCPACHSPDVRTFYDVPEVPVHSVLLVRTREEALQFPRGTIELACCHGCGFIFNRTFDASLLHYSQEYEETQGFSPTFTGFHRRLAEDVIVRYGLHGRRVIEIGCGKGDFLNLLCELGDNDGVGFDPAYVPERDARSGAGRVRFIQDLYSERYADHHADFICCKMTLEHIDDVASFLATVRRSIGDRPDTVVFFQIPEVRRILADVAFWDIYYEHCSYFSPGSLARLFRASGFDVSDLWTDYDDQYLMIEARPASDASTTIHEREETVEQLVAEVSSFQTAATERLESWRGLLSASHTEGRRTVLWGGGSKAVAFLTTLGIGTEIAAAVDINPYRHGTFLAGTGHEIVGPAALAELRPDAVIIMNSIYRSEIEADLRKLGLTPDILEIDRLPVAA